ncbi:hypothetical protein DL546_007554 [Coniochaeta pulveracea]|uniref:SigF-like NTF2-like domain-containing protein n=1 Tax=Coniochaeta pulveracea TaxID=177199 RepID=A0A420YFX6_9PEZI|nr:hypothetical protein DL546_007554 [Coniochaeta pulveracea]
MEKPTAEIESVVRALAQGSPNEQRDALETYFLPDAEFVHPFCRVPAFSHLRLPFLGTINSRDLIHSIFQWYRFMSPRIDLTIDSILMDENKKTLYLAMHQRFALWIIPFYAARVHMVTVLHLAEEQERILVPGGGLPSYAQAAASRQPLLSGSRKDPAVTFDGNSATHVEPEPQPRKKYYIAKQEDLYQVSEWIKFLVPFGIGNAMVSGYMLLVTMFCVMGSLVTLPIVYIATAGGQTGNVAPPNKGLKQDKGRFAGGATWTPRVFSPLSSAVGLH